MSREFDPDKPPERSEYSSQATFFKALEEWSKAVGKDPSRLARRTTRMEKSKKKPGVEISFVPRTVSGFSTVQSAPLVEPAPEVIEIVENPQVNVDEASTQLDEEPNIFNMGPALPIDKNRKRGFTTKAHRYSKYDRVDINYCDAGFEEEIHEDGVIYNSILKVPRNSDGRWTDTIVVYQIDVIAELKIESGSAASPRIILFLDKQPPGLDNYLIDGANVVKSRSVRDILAPNPIYEMGNVEQGELPDLERKPTNMSGYNFINTKSGLTDCITILYDVYRDLHPFITKAEVDTVPAKEIVKFSLKDLDIVVKFATSDPQSIIMNNISFMWIGDYQGGVCMGTLISRCYYYCV